MACIIAAPNSSSGKTLVSLLLAAWARNKGLNLQPFKVGPDYLDPQHLSAVSGRPCRNLDPILCGSQWVKESFHGFGGKADLALIEGVMGLYDGVGSSTKGSTAAIAKELNLPVVLVVNASGQAASLGALIRGFKEHKPRIRLAGVVINRVNTQRHKDLLIDVLSSIQVKVLGCLPTNPDLKINSQHLGLAPAHEILNLESKIQILAAIAESKLDLRAFKTLLKAPKSSKNPMTRLLEKNNIRNESILYPIAVAEDNAFHFKYTETKEFLEMLGMPVIIWRPLENKPLPHDAKGLIIPGGFPEQYAKELSQCSTTLKAIKSSIFKLPIYAECGGMLLLGETLTDLQGEKQPMAGILPFHAKKGSLKVGYRTLKGIQNSLIIDFGENLIGHEFHYWDLTHAKHNPKVDTHKYDKNKAGLITAPWEASGWNINPKEEGWSNKMLHASWIHLHWPSHPNILFKWRSTLEKYSTYND